ncbi:family S53 protease-like protein [Mycena floridula]|nr:family S53 protease-like protein [Mycena floridula]
MLLLAFASVLAVVTASPSFHSWSLKDAHRTVPDGYSALAAPKPDTVIHLRIALRANDMAGLETVLYKVSTPGSSEYGQYLDYGGASDAFYRDILELIANKWLHQYGITDYTASGTFNDWIDISIPVAKADLLLNARFSTFLHDSTGEKYIRTLSYGLPIDLLGHIDLVHPTTSFAQPLYSGPIFTSAAGVSAGTTQVSPPVLSNRYHIPPSSVKQSMNTSIAVTGFIGQYAQDADLKTFLDQFRPDMPPATGFNVVTLDGGMNPQSPRYAGIEANLDIQYTVGVATNVPTTFISVGPNNNDRVAGFYDLADMLLNMSSPYLTLTTSYGFNEGDLDPSWATKLCDTYKMLGARGVSCLFSSGDGGPSGSQNATCHKFAPTFPSGCPWITSVGSTDASEVGSTFSSGGFSNIFPRPDYQDEAVSQYLNVTFNTPDPKYRVKTLNRAYPDVALLGENYLIANGGKCMIALINGELLAAGKPSLGFLNPWLYQNAKMFNDILTSNVLPGCGSRDTYVAGQGWDPVTSLGTVTYDSLWALFHHNAATWKDGRPHQESH